MTPDMAALQAGGTPARVDPAMPNRTTQGVFSPIAQTMPARALLLGLALAASACSGPARAPIADRPINLEGHCEQRESDGFREQAHVSVRSNQVHSLSWRLWVGSRGSCQFEFADFRQTRARPHIELTARDGSGCRLLIWQDDRRITLGHAGCASRCTGSILEEAWPVMFDPRSGACARTAS